MVWAAAAGLNIRTPSWPCHAMSAPVADHHDQGPSATEALITCATAFQYSREHRPPFPHTHTGLALIMFIIAQCGGFHVLKVGSAPRLAARQGGAQARRFTCSIMCMHHSITRIGRTFICHMCSLVPPCCSAVRLQGTWAWMEDLHILILLCRTLVTGCW